MRKEPDRQAVLAMHHSGCSIRKISQLMKMSRKTVRSIIDHQHGQKINRPSRYEALQPLVKELFGRCQGNATLIQRMLKDNYDHDIPYTSLTRLVRRLQLRPTHKNRSGSFQYLPGAEAQHDTSPHRANIGGKIVKVQCAAFVLACSRLLYMQYYPRFTRFEAKVFLDQALSYMDSVPEQCIIDNTSVILASGSGADAVIAPELEAFARIYGFRFVAHAIGHADRKAIVERNFSYIEKNFLPGRTFNDFHDLNRQAIHWCDTVANEKNKRSLSMTPRQAYLAERPMLKPLPAFKPPIYQCLSRVVDLYGYVSVDTNRYSVPQSCCGKTVEVHKLPDHICVFFNRKKIAEHSRIIDRCNAKATAPGHHLQPRKQTLRLSGKLQKSLTGDNEALDQYLQLLKKRSRSSAVRSMQRLLNFKRNYPKQAFDKAIERALKYGLYDLNRLENLILSLVAGDFFNITDHDDEK
ncbi:MAG: hypothetical protein R6W88_07460 [Desulfobacterales bacterium]